MGKYDLAEQDRGRKMATTKAAGLSQVATNTQVATGTRADRVVSPVGLTSMKATDTQTLALTATDKFVTPANLAALEAATKVTFQSQPVATQADGTTASGTDTEVNNMVVDGGVIFEYINIGTQTLLVPAIAAGGLNIARDLTDNEGTEYSQGITSAGKHAYTIGTDGPFHLRCTLNAADVSGIDPLVIGFRKAAAYNADFNAYTDVACIGIDGENNPAKLQIVTNLNNAGAVLTDTTDTLADATNVILDVIVSAAGVVTFLIDGVAPTVTKAFTFDSTDVVIPFIHLLHATTTPGAVYLIDYECEVV